MILWKINQSCNFRCKYYFLKRSELSKEHPCSGKYPPQHIARCFDRTSKKWTVLMTGGEPFIYPNFVGLCQELTGNHTIAVNSNLSTSNVEHFAGEIDPGKVALVYAAFHVSELERTGRRKAFLKNIQHLQNRGFPVCIEYVFYPPLIQRIEDDLRQLDSAGVRFVNLKVFRGLYRSKVYPHAYSFEELDFFRRHTLDDREPEYIEKKFSFFGKICHTGTDFIFMDIGGNLRRCPGSAKSYGNIFSGNLILDERPRPCPFARCFSPWIGRESAEDRALNFHLTVNEILREGVPFVFKRGRMSSVFHSLRNSLSD